MRGKNQSIETDLEITWMIALLDKHIKNSYFITVFQMIRSQKKDLAYLSKDIEYILKTQIELQKMKITKLEI